MLAFVGPSGGEAYVEAELDLPDGLPRRAGVRLARGAAPGGRAGTRRRTARIRRRSQSRVRLGPDRAEGGRGSARRAADRDVRPVRAAPSCPSRPSTRHARCILPERSSCVAAEARPWRGARSRRRGSTATSWPRAAAGRESAGRGARSARRGSGRHRAGYRGLASRASESGCGTPRESPRRPRAPPTRCLRTAARRTEQPTSSRRRTWRWLRRGGACAGAGGLHHRASRTSRDVLRDTGSELRRLPRVARGGAGTGSSRSRSVSRASPTRSAGSPSRRTRSCWMRAAAARDELAALESGNDPVAVAEAALATAESGTWSQSQALRAARTESAVPFADAARAELASLGLGDGDLRVEIGERDPGPVGCDDVGFLIRPNRGPAVRTGRVDGLGRGAVPHRARPPCGCPRPGWRADHRLRRDRCRHRRPHGTCGRGVARTPRAASPRSSRSRTCRKSRASPTASTGWRRFAGDPTHTRIEVLDEAERADELERMLGGTEFSPGDPMSALVEFNGTARLDKRTKRARQAPRARRHRDHRPRRPRPRLGRGAGRVGRPGRRQRVPVDQPGRYPNPGPLAARPRRRPPDRRARRPALRAGRARGARSSVRGSALFRNGDARRHRPSSRGRELEQLTRRAAGPRHRGARGVRRQHDAATCARRGSSSPRVSSSRS